jgi:hypothetical protein
MPSSQSLRFVFGTTEIAERVEISGLSESVLLCFACVSEGSLFHIDLSLNHIPLSKADPNTK